MSSNRFIVLHLNELFITYNDLPEEYREYSFIKLFDLFELGDVIVAHMQFRTSIDMRIIFESELYGRWLVQVKEFLISNERSVKFTRDIFNFYIDHIDALLREHAGEVITIDTFEVTQTENELILIPKEEQYDTEESYSGQRQRLSSHSFF